jgi:hypothetical protein
MSVCRDFVVRCGCGVGLCMFYMYLGLCHRLILVFNDRYISLPCHGMAVVLLPEQRAEFVVLHREGVKMHQLSVFGASNWHFRLLAIVMGSSYSHFLTAGFLCKISCSRAIATGPVGSTIVNGLLSLPMCPPLCLVSYCPLLRSK